jgi:putative ABC transport system permease protein
MNWLALKMLTGDRAKYLSLIFSVMFATLLMTQQISIFMGIVRRSASQVDDVRDADIWVMDAKTRQIDEAPNLLPQDLQRVRGVEGVDWAVNFHKGQAQARLENGAFRTVTLVAVDDASMVGAPRDMIVGDYESLRQPDAMIVDKAGFEYMWPGQPMTIGRVFQINDRRVVLVGVCKASPPFVTLPVIYCRMSNAERFAVGSRHLPNFVLASVKPGQNPEEVCQRIRERTDLAAYTKNQFFWKTINYMLSSTGIPVNFGITIALGFIVGVAVTGQTFYLFTLENLKQFGSLKAMGVTNWRLMQMILLQATTVGAMGYSLGIGATAVFFTYTNRITHLAGINMTWLAASFVGAAVLMIIVVVSLFSLRKVLVLEPAVVFRG